MHLGLPSCHIPICTMLLRPPSCMSALCARQRPAKHTVLWTAACNSTSSPLRHNRRCRGKCFRLLLHHQQRRVHHSKTNLIAVKPAALCTACQNLDSMLPIGLSRMPTAQPVVVAGVRQQQPARGEASMLPACGWPNLRTGSMSSQQGARPSSTSAAAKSRRASGTAGITDKARCLLLHSFACMPCNHHT